MLGDQGGVGRKEQEEGRKRGRQRGRWLEDEGGNMGMGQ